MAKTPKDELLLAEMIAAAKSRGMKGCRGWAFMNDKNSHVSMEHATQCSALGALALARGIPDVECRGVVAGLNAESIWLGNNYDNRWYPVVGGGADGESLGWAFRNAME